MLCIFPCMKCVWAGAVGASSSSVLHHLLAAGKGQSRRNRVCSWRECILGKRRWESSGCWRTRASSSCITKLYSISGSAITLIQTNKQMLSIASHRAKGVRKVRWDEGTYNTVPRRDDGSCNTMNLAKMHSDSHYLPCLSTYINSSRPPSLTLPNAQSVDQIYPCRPPMRLVPAHS